MDGKIYGPSVHPFARAELERSDVVMVQRLAGERGGGRVQIAPLTVLRLKRAKFNPTTHPPLPASPFTHVLSLSLILIAVRYQLKVVAAANVATCGCPTCADFSK